MAILSHEAFAGIEQAVSRDILGQSQNVSLRSAFGMGANLEGIASNLRFDSSIDTNPGLNQ